MGTHLPELGHGFTGNDLIVVQPCDKAQCLELTLPLLQLPQDQGSEYLHVLKGRGRRMETSGMERSQTSPGEYQRLPLQTPPSSDNQETAYLFHSYP